MINFKIKDFLKEKIMGKKYGKDKLMQAKWNGKTIAESDKTIVIERNHYFPADAVNKEYLKENSKTTICSWKGTASYYNVLVDGKTNVAAAWYYPDPSEKAKHIKGYIAFWSGVKISG